MKNVKNTVSSLTSVCCAVFIFAASFASDSVALSLNDYVLEVKAMSDGNDNQGVIPVMVTVTYEGAGVDILTADNFSTKNEAQITPQDCPALVLDPTEFHNRGDGIYHLGLIAEMGSLCTGTYFIPLKVDARSGLAIKASGITILEIFRFSFDL